ncbi:MAG: DUF4136 domain-containing protein [Sphingomonas sp.]|jgi:hypothetical protein|uniref:DUF4136 domain-containing protein n=1 Tax=Sphingomonas sp. TaxID=28214 RepID=UPI003564AF65
MTAARTLLIALAATGLAGSLAGCATTVSGPVQVTRFHLGAPLERGTVTVEPLPGGGPASLEFSTYASAVEAELIQSGYTAAPADVRGQYLAVVGFTRTTLEGPPKPPPFSIGLGGGTYSGGRGGGVGIGGGVSIPIGKSKSRYVVATELSVQIRRRSDGTVIWEGRAQTQADDKAPEAQANVAAGKLAHALFLGFPGESGRSITVK